MGFPWGPPPPCKQALSGRSRGEAQGVCSLPPPPPIFRQNQICQGKKSCFIKHSSYLKVWMSPPLKVVSKARHERTHQQVAQLQIGAFSTPPTPHSCTPFWVPLVAELSQYLPNRKLACRVLLYLLTSRSSTFVIFRNDCVMCKDSRENYDSFAGVSGNGVGSISSSSLSSLDSDDLLKELSH